VEDQHSDVSDPFHPQEIGSVRIGGIVGRKAHPARPGRPLAGGPADGGGQPGLQAGLLHQLAVRLVGRSVQGGDASSDSYCYPPD
jgi:hypothetical protein